MAAIKCKMCGGTIEFEERRIDSRGIRPALWVDISNL